MHLGLCRVDDGHADADGDVRRRRCGTAEGAREYRVPLQGGAIILLFPGETIKSHNPLVATQRIPPSWTRCRGTFPRMGIGLLKNFVLRDFEVGSHVSLKLAFNTAYKAVASARRWLQTHVLNPTCGMIIEERSVAVSSRQGTSIGQARLDEVQLGLGAEPDGSIQSVKLRPLNSAWQSVSHPFRMSAENRDATGKKSSSSVPLNRLACALSA